MAEGTERTHPGPQVHTDCSGISGRSYLRAIFRHISVSHSISHLYLCGRVFLINTPLQRGVNKSWLVACQEFVMRPALREPVDAIGTGRSPPITFSPAFCWQLAIVAPWAISSNKSRKLSAARNFFVTGKASSWPFRVDSIRWFCCACCIGWRRNSTG